MRLYRANFSTNAERVALALGHKGNEVVDPVQMVIIALGREMRIALDGFESLLSGRKFLMGSELSAADCAVFPFVKYALKREPADSEPFHRVLDEYQQLDGDDHMRLRSWIKRIDALPRA